MSSVNFLLVGFVIVIIVGSSAVLISAGGRPAAIARRRQVTIVDHSNVVSNQLSSASVYQQDGDPASPEAQRQQQEAADAQQKRRGESLQDFDFNFGNWMDYHRRKKDIAAGNQLGEDDPQSAEGSKKRKPQNIEALVDRFVSGNLILSAPQAHDAATAATAGNPFASGDGHQRRFGRGYSHLTNMYQHRGFATSAGGSASGTCATDEFLRVDFIVDTESEDGKIYGNSWSSGYHALGKDEVFEYEIQWLTEDCNCGVEIESNEWRLRDHASLDAQGYSPHSEYNANMSRVAFRKWYRRRWLLPDKLDGQFIDKVTFSALGRPGGSKGTALFRNVRIVKLDPKTGKDLETKKWLWKAGESGPMSVTNSFFKGSITSNCQPPFLVGIAAENSFDGGSNIAPNSFSGPYPLRRGVESRLSFTLDATSDLNGGSSAAAGAGDDGSTPPAGARIIDTQTSFLRGVQQQEEEEAAEEKLSSTIPRLVSTFRDIGAARLSHRAAVPPFPYPSKWSNSKFNQIDHVLLRRKALLVLNWTARLKLTQAATGLSSAYSGSAQADVTVWDLLMLPAMRQRGTQQQQQQQQQNHSSADEFVEPCRSRFILGNGSSLSAFETKAGCAVREFLQTRESELQHIQDEKLAAITALEAETKQREEQEVAAAAVEGGKSAEKQKKERAEQEVKDRIESELHNQRNDLGDEFDVKKEDSAVLWDEKFFPLLHALATREDVTVDSGFPFFGSVPFAIPGDDESWVVLVNRLVGQHGAKLAKMKKKNVNSNNVTSSSTVPPPVTNAFAELEVKVSYLIVSLTVTSSKDNLQGFEDMAVREARVLTSTFGADDFEIDKE